MDLIINHLSLDCRWCRPYVSYIFLSNAMDTPCLDCQHQILVNDQNITWRTQWKIYKNPMLINHQKHLKATAKLYKNPMAWRFWAWMEFIRQSWSNLKRTAFGDFFSHPYETPWVIIIANIKWTLSDHSGMRHRLRELCLLWLTGEIFATTVSGVSQWNHK